MNKKSYRILTAIFLFLTACQSQEMRGTKTLTLNLQEGDPPSLNPYLGVDLRSRCLFLALFEPLMRRSSSGKLEPAAARAVEIDATHTLYTFRIRPHTWSNGERVTSYHFADSWRYALKPGSHCIRADLFYPIKNAEKVKKGLLPMEALGLWTPDPETLVVEMDHPTPYFLDLTASSFFLPVYTATDAEPTFFNGPFVPAEHLPDQKLVFVKNPNYWDTQNVDLEKICFTLVKDPSTALSMYEKKELDVVGDPFSSLPFDAIPDLEKTGNLQSKLISRIFYLLLNAETFPFNDTSMRKALSLALDRHEIAENLFLGELATFSLLPRPLSLTADEKWNGSKEDPVALFEEALDKLYLTRETFPKLTLSYAELSGQKRLAEYIQRVWKEKLGIEIEIECAEWNVHIAKLRKRDYQIGTLHLTTLYQDPMFYFDLFKSKESLSNYCGWENVRFKALLEKADAALDVCDRAQYLKKAEQCLFEEMPVIPLFTQNLQYMTRDGVNLEISDLGILDFKATRMAR